MGLNRILSEFLWALPREGVEFLLAMFNKFLAGGPPPSGWGITRVVLLIRGKRKDKQVLDSYRPVAIGKCVYKVYASLLRDWVSAIIEQSGQLVEFQNGFRKGMRVSDTLFTQLIEYSQRGKEPLYVTFLDIRGPLITLIERSYEGFCPGTGFLDHCSWQCRTCIIGQIMISTGESIVQAP